MYYRQFADEDGEDIKDFFNDIEYKDVAELCLEVNTICCHNLCAKIYLMNNDINISASYLHVDFSQDNLFEFHAYPFLWNFCLNVMQIGRLGQYPD